MTRNLLLWRLAERPTTILGRIYQHIYDQEVLAMGLELPSLDAIGPKVETLPRPIQIALNDVMFLAIDCALDAQKQGGYHV